jgi:drug/metabolite transporter (DMT)-like permease
MNSNRRIFTALVSAGLLWGTTVPLSKLALHWLSPGWLTFVRFAVAAAILLPAARHQLRAAFRPSVLVSGALGYGATVAVQNAGITRTSVTHAALLIGTVPVLVAIIAAVWHRTVARPVAWAGFALSLAGVGLVTGGHGGGASTAGDALVLASLLLSATFTVAQARLLHGRDPIALTAVQFLGAALAVLPFAAVTEAGPAMPGTAGPVLATAVLAAGGTLLPFALFAYAQSRVSAEVAGAFLNIEPLVGAVAGAMFFGNPAGPEQLTGGLAILAGIALSSLPLLAAGRAAQRESPSDPVTVTHEIAAGQLVHLAPGLDTPRADAEAGVRVGQLARVEAGLDGEGVTCGGRNVGRRGYRLHGPLDQHQVAGRADAQPDLARGLQVAAGRAGGRGRNQHGGPVPQERQRHHAGGAAARVGRGHPRVGVVLEPAQRAGLALLQGPGGVGPDSVGHRAGPVTEPGRALGEGQRGPLGARSQRLDGHHRVRNDHRGVRHLSMPECYSPESADAA